MGDQEPYPIKFITGLPNHYDLVLDSLHKYTIAKQMMNYYLIGKERGGIFNNSSQCGVGKEL